MYTTTPHVLKALVSHCAFQAGANAKKKHWFIIIQIKLWHKYALAKCVTQVDGRISRLL